MSACPTFATIEPRIARPGGTSGLLDRRVADGGSAKANGAGIATGPTLTDAWSQGNLAPGVSIPGPSGPRTYVARRSRRHPDHPGGRFGAEERSLLPYRVSVDPKPFFRCGPPSCRSTIAHEGFWRVADVAPGSPVMPSRPSPLRSFLIRDPRKVRERWFVPCCAAFAGISSGS